MNKKLLVSLLVATLHLTAVPTFGQAVWNQFNGPFAGEISSFAKWGDALYCGSTHTGVFKSVDQGKTWARVFPEITYVFSLYVHDNALFLGSDRLYQYDASGLKAVSQSVTGVIVYMQTFKGELFVTTDYGIFLYDAASQLLVPKNNGMPITPESVRWTRDLAFVDDVLFCNAIAFGLYKSTDNGEQWTKVDVSGYNYGFSDMVTRGDSLICSSYGGHLFLSTNKGDTWSNINLNLPGYFSYYRLIVADNRLVTVAYSNGTYELKDGTSEWVKISELEFSDFAYIDHTFLGSDRGGMYRWNEQEDEFVLSNVGINTSRVNEIELFNGKLYSATEMGVHFTATDGDEWSVVPELHDLYTHAIAKKDTVLFAGTSVGIFTTSTNCPGWRKSENGLPNPALWEIDVTNDCVFIGTDDGVYVSYTNGNLWKLLPNSTSTIAQMTTVGANDSMLVAGNTTGLYRILEDSSNWEPIPFFKGKEIFSINIIDGVIYAGSMNSSIYRSFDYGDTWSVSNIPAFSDVDMIKRGDNIYASNYNQVFYSADAGNSWDYFYETGIPDILITSITEGDSAFYIGTYGKSIWRRPFLAITDIDSDLYTITDSLIYDIEPGTALTDFRENVTLGYGTSLAVDHIGSSSGRMQTDNTLQIDDKIKVIAEDGKSIRTLRIAKEKNITAVEEEKNRLLLAYPIPAKDKLFFSNPDKIKTYWIQNGFGQKLPVTRYNDHLDVSDLSKGLYILTVQTTQNQKHILKFTKE